MDNEQNGAGTWSATDCGTVVIGAGQAGLAVAHHLAGHGLDFVVLDAGARVGDVWRQRYDSLRLFTPARYDGLPGMAFPAPARSFPDRNEMADYLEGYARHFRLPVRCGQRVTSVSALDGRYQVRTGRGAILADNVVIATGAYQAPAVPALAAALDPAIRQLHSRDYRNPGQVPAGPVLVVGGGNSGADIALELAAAGHAVTLAGRDVGQLPFAIGGPLARMGLVRLVLRGIFHHVLTTRTPIGRRARPAMLRHGGPLIRVRRRDLEAAGVRRGPRVDSVRGGRPVLADGQVADVATVVWCTGFRTDLSWLDVPGVRVAGLGHDLPSQDRGVAQDAPGLFFVGQFFLYSLSSAMIHGVGRDAAHVADAIARRSAAAHGLVRAAAQPSSLA